MSDSIDSALLVGALARQLGVVSDDELALCINDWTRDDSQDFSSLLQERTQIDKETWESLRTLASKRLARRDGLANDSFGTLCHPPGVVSETLTRALKDSGNEDLWKTFTMGTVAGEHITDTGDDPLKTLLPADSTSAVGQDASHRGVRFQKVKRHAEGGLGQVFVAIDDELNRQVALKQIQERFAGDSGARQRFMLEAEITGGLEHPGVVPVYGLGIYEDGHPYYAMRFIRGESLQDAIDALQKRYPVNDARLVRDPLRLFELRKLLSRIIDVCQAIGYAHSRGVLHRDIKPDNIMLGKFGETLVVDWGLAKVAGNDEPTSATSASSEPKLQPASSVGSVPTQVGSIVGTPGFMSPEQAGGDIDGVDARSDVYSLGATLYALLVGSPAIGSKDALGRPRSLEQILAAVRAGEYRPVREVVPTLPKPLAAICERAMAKSPSDRYETPVEMAEDIERWLADEPVSAYQESAGERTRRWIKRHQSLAASVAAIVLVSICGLTVFSLILGQKNVQLARSEAIAKDEAATSKAVTDFLNDDLLAQASMQDHPDPRLEVRTVLDRAADDLETQFVEKPIVKAKLLKTIGIAYGYLGEFAKAEKALEPSVALYTEHLGAGHETTIARQSELAAVVAKSGQYERGKELLESSLGRLIDMHGAEHLTVVAAQAELADLYQWLGDYENAERLIQQAIDGSTKLLGADDADTLELEVMKASVWNYRSRLNDAITLGQSLVQRAETVFGPDHLVTLEAKTVLAQSWFFDENYAAAKPLYVDLLQRSARLLGQEHPSTLAIRHDLALLAAYRGNLADSLTELEQIRSLSQEIYGEQHRETIINDLSIAEALSQMDRSEEARALLENTLARAEAALGALNPETRRIRFTLAEVYVDLEELGKAVPILQAFIESPASAIRRVDTTPWDARVLLAEIIFYDEQYEQAIELLNEARAGYAKARGKRAAWASRAVDDLLWAYVLNDQSASAETLLDQVVEAQELNDEDTASAVLSLADALIEVEQFESAEQKVNEIIAWANADNDPTQSSLQIMRDLADRLVRLERYEDAMLQYQRVLSQQTDLLGPENSDTLVTLAELAFAMEQNSRPEEAVQVYERLLQSEKNVYGEQSPQALLTLGALSKLRVEQGKHQQAIEYLLPIRRIQTETGQGADILALTNLALADSYRQIGEYANAIKYYKAAVADYQPQDDDVSRLLTLHHLAWCYSKNSQPDESIKMYRRVVDGRSRVLGQTHEYTLLSLGNLAYLQAGQQHEQTKDTLGDLESRLGVSETNAPGTGTAAYMLGESYRVLAEYAAAIRWYRAAVDWRTETLGASHADTLLAMHQIGYTYSLSGNRPEAAKVYARVVPLREQVLGKSHEYTLLSLANWGVTEALMENYDDAIRLLEDALQRIVQAKGKDDPLAIQPRMTLASAHYLQGNFIRAIQLFRETLEVTYRRISNPTDRVKREIAMLQIVLADSEVHAGRFDDAYQHATEGLDTMPGVDPDRLDYYRAQSILGEVHAHRGKFTKATDLLEDAFAGLTELRDHPNQEKRLRLRMDTVDRLIKAYEEAENEEKLNQWQQTREKLQHQVDG